MPSPLTKLDRRFRRIERIFTELCSSGSVSTTDPSKITVEDVKAFAVHLRKARKVSPGALQHDIGTLGTLCLFCGNDSVRSSRARYPSAFPAYRKVRGSVLDPSEFGSGVVYAGVCSGMVGEFIIHWASRLKLFFEACVAAPQDSDESIHPYAFYGFCAALPGPARRL